MQLDSVKTETLYMGFIAAFAGILFGAMSGQLYAQQISLDAPTESVVGAEVNGRIDGETQGRVFVTIVPPGTAEGEYAAYQYVRRGTVSLSAPVDPGDYEIRLLQAERPFATLASQPLKVMDAVATLEAPNRVDGGAEFEVAWTGPDNARDFISIVPVGTPEGKYERGYRYTKNGSPLKITAPETVGDYEIRYLMGTSPYRTLGRRTLSVAGVDASVTTPAQVNAGSLFEVAWEGPDNRQDFLTIVVAGTPEKEYGNYAYTKIGNPAKLLAPDEPGPHEVRYLTGQNYTMLASAPIKLLPLSATVSGPATVEARSVAVVTWEGPDNPQDYVIILPLNENNGVNGHYAYTARGRELRIQMPSEPGEYEFRYQTARGHKTLASQAVTVTPRPIPGQLRVVSADLASGQTQGAAVVVVLDASGSMLQRMDGQRRIDIAKEAVSQLIQTDLAPDVRFSLRVFGHKERDSCRTDVEIPLGPLDRPRATAAVASVEAMNLAKTPIAATLAKVGADLAEVPGPSLIIVLTDGEETCDGDPGAVIESLADSGMDVRVNIVGFAIDELMLRETFQAWARLGNGQYFDARNAQELASGLSQAVDTPFQVFSNEGNVITQGTVNGPAIELAAGEYTVKAAAGDVTYSVSITADELNVLTLERN